MKMKITKIDAAVFQLKEAINLFFAGRDPVSINTLVGASLQILNDNINDKGKIKDNKVFLHYLYLENKNAKKVRDEIKYARNFFKHAGRDIPKKNLLLNLKQN